MKMYIEDYKTLKAQMQKFIYANEAACKEHMAKHSDVRFTWDIVNACGAMPFICDVLYKYLNDTHIQTALNKIVKETPILWATDNTLQK